MIFLSGFFYCLVSWASALVNINTANLAELDALPGIGPAKAQAIIDYRTANGNFLTKEDIKSVSGIGEATYEDLKGLITVGEAHDVLPGADGNMLEQEICGNRMIEGAEECDDGNRETGDGCGADCRLEVKTETAPSEQSGQDLEAKKSDYRVGDVLINEFVSDPADDDVEWVELFNNSRNNVNFEGWTLEDGSGAKTALSGTMGKDGASRYYVLEKPKGNLNNAGDAIVLRYAGKLIDAVAYGKWDDGNIGDNAPSAADPFSTARKLDGYDAGSDQNDFGVSAKPTKKAANVIVVPDAEGEDAEETEKTGYDYSDSISISEIFPDPPGNDAEDEFIELYNSSERAVDLSLWRLGDDSSRKYEIKSEADKGFSAIIKPKSFLAIKRSSSKIALNNGGDAVSLFRPFEDKAFVSVRYERSFEGQSYNLVSAGKYVWSETVTLGKENILKTANRAPLVSFDCPEEALAGQAFLFDSSDTLDEDGDKLSFVWDFGDGATNTLALPEHTYFRAGKFTVELRVSDGKTEAKKEKILVIEENRVKAQTEIAHSQSEDKTDADYHILINEIMPNPDGADNEEEFIEIYNSGGVRINLRDWRVDDMEGGSKPYIFKNEFLLEAGKYLLLERKESGLSLNNSDDAVRLFDPIGVIADEVSYGKTMPGEAYARGVNNKWFWTIAPTPGEANVIKAGSEIAADVGGVIVKGASMRVAKATKSEAYIDTTLEKVGSLETGDKVRLSGTVAVLPGILGSQYFYIVGSPGIQVYNYKKDFPNLKIGDFVDIRGELAESGGERRLKTKSAGDIMLVAHKSPPIAPLETCEKIDEEYVGRLISVSGEIVDRKSATVFLDDGTGEIKVYIKTASGINPAELREGERADISGIVGRTSAGIRLLPRGRGDIVLKNSGLAENSEVLGEVAVADEWELAARDKKLELFKYLLAALGGLAIILAGALFKLRRG